MQYPSIPTNLKQATFAELAKADSQLRLYKNVTVLSIPHWRAIPQLVAVASDISRTQRRIAKEIKTRPEYQQAAAARSLVVKLDDDAQKLDEARTKAETSVAKLEALWQVAA